MSRLFYYTFHAFCNSLNVGPRQHTNPSEKLHKLLEAWQTRDDHAIMAMDLQKIGTDFVKACDQYQAKRMTNA